MQFCNSTYNALQASVAPTSKGRCCTSGWIALHINGVLDSLHMQSGFNTSPPLQNMHLDVCRNAQGVYSIVHCSSAFAIQQLQCKTCNSATALTAIQQLQPHATQHATNLSYSTEVMVQAMGSRRDHGATALSKANI